MTRKRLPSIEWQKRTKRKETSYAKFRQWTSTDKQFIICFTESTLSPKPWKKLPKDQRSKYIKPYYKCYVQDDPQDPSLGYTILVDPKKRFGTFNAAEKVIKQYIRNAS